MKILNNNKSILLIAILCVIIAIVCSDYAFAADYPYRLNSEKASKEMGIGREQVSLFMPLPGPGKNVIVEKLMAKFKDSKTPITTSGTVEKREKREKISLIAEGWTLDVNKDGTNVSYRNYKFLESKPELARPINRRLSNEKLEELGRVFIKENLSEFIKLGANEELMPFYSEHAIGGGGSTKRGTAADEEKVYASTIVFTRTIDKISIIGAGSKIAIMFNNEGVPVGFDFDWTQYRPTDKFQKVLPVAEIRKRAKRLASLDIDSSNVEVSRFDCGYYDAGARKRDAKAFMQAGCSIHYHEKKIVDKNIYRQNPNSGHTVAAYVDFIPAGETVEPDEKWQQALKILDKKIISDSVVPKEGPKQR